MLKCRQITREDSASSLPISALTQLTWPELCARQWPGQTNTLVFLLLLTADQVPNLPQSRADTACAPYKVRVYSGIHSDRGNAAQSWSSATCVPVVCTLKTRVISRTSYVNIYAFNACKYFLKACGSVSLTLWTMLSNHINSMKISLILIVWKSDWDGSEAVLHLKYM